MAIGYFLRVGDRTTCGGQILTGNNTMQWYGVAGARESDMVSCGKHSGPFYIIGGCNSVWDEGRKVAGTLESMSSCPCHARFINSIHDCYSDESGSASPETASTIPPVITNKICISCLMKAAESGQMLVVREG
ncbi:PAAR domain-containing protein [Moellerella wisconsensis]|uniref:Uropathogenic specific protein n=1 Tax=Moellerella wisconsensis ATCC 35017 TaxID=1354267 RepID=A0A0N0IBF2_9GAMM|nr:PAAR domain-containing protein [Moellerella wisconsensis]KPD03760.1 uropathogenic specific protein [Moellerella wisconsensis ATCC 35017]VFS50061.1 Pyocin large subunit [Moellerella wisconsensis]